MNILTDIHFYTVFRQSREYLKMAGAEERVAVEEEATVEVSEKVGRKVGRKPEENIRFSKNKSLYF